MFTFVDYVSPPNALDVSNSNTPAVLEPGNTETTPPTFRAVVEMDTQGSFTRTTSNAYSGNNGRAAIKANGLYYVVGNAGNANGSPQVTNAAGAQIVIPGQQASTILPGTIQDGFFDIVQTGQKADKPPKDNNFRGETIFNNTLYVTKGSGGNGINTVYQVGNSGSLPTLATAAAISTAGPELTPDIGINTNVAINVLPGFPTVPAKTGPILYYPFGLWFANATTLYVSDEGDGVLADVTNPAMSNGGLQKWIFSNGTWTLAYNLTNGLNLGVPYSVPDGPNGAVYPTGINPATGVSWTPATDGLRNIIGQTNSDGTVTIFAVTSTVSGATDQGGDPNLLVSITDNPSFTSASQAASEQFAQLKTAVDGEVLRGVALVPSPLTVSANPATGEVNKAIPLSVNAVVKNPAFPQTIAIQISNVPLTATLSAGTNAGSGVWNLTSAQLTGLTITPTVACNAALLVTATDLDASSNPIGTATATINLTVNPHPAPVASNGTLAVTGTALTTGTLNATDADSDPLTFGIVSAAGKGTATIVNAADGIYTYKANAGASGTDTFTFNASDGVLNSNTATVTVTITPFAPPVAFNGEVVANGTTPIAGTLLATDSNSPSLTYAIVANGTKGIATIINVATGAFTYTAGANVNATDAFTFKVSDVNGTSNVATVTVTILQQNPAPIAVISVSTGPFTAPASIAFDGSGSSTNIVAYEWDFGDGTQGFDPKPIHKYTASGAFTVTLIVINDAGVASAPSTTTIVIAAATPPPLTADVFAGKFSKQGHTALKMEVTLPVGTTAGSSIAVSIKTYSDTFKVDSDGKMAKGPSGMVKIDGSKLTFSIKAAATALFGSPAPTTGSQVVNITVNGVEYQKTVTFTTKGNGTSFE